jgi:hypothetical protein
MLVRHTVRRNTVPGHAADLQDRAVTSLFRGRSSPEVRARASPIGVYMIQSGLILRFDTGAIRLCRLLDIVPDRLAASCEIKSVAMEVATVRFQGITGQTTEESPCDQHGARLQ